MSKISQLIQSMKYNLFTPPHIKRLDKGLYFAEKCTGYTGYDMGIFYAKWEWEYTPSIDLYKLSNIRYVCGCGFEYQPENPNICPTCKRPAITKDDAIGLLMSIDKSFYFKFVADND